MIPKIPSEEYPAHIPIKQHHSRARNMLRIEHPKANLQLLITLPPHLNLIFLVVFTLDNPQTVLCCLGKFVQNEQFCDFRAVYQSVVP